MDGCRGWEWWGALRSYRALSARVRSWDFVLKAVEIFGGSGEGEWHDLFLLFFKYHSGLFVAVNFRGHRSGSQEAS